MNSGTEMQLQAKIIASVESLWQKVLQTKERYKTAIFVHSIVPVKHLDALFKTGEPAGLYSMLRAYKDVGYMTEDIGTFQDNERIYVGVKLWTVFHAIRVFHGRLGMLIHDSLEQKECVDWRRDEIVEPLLRTVLSEDEVNRAIEMQTEGVKEIVEKLEFEFLKEAALVMVSPQRVQESFSSEPQQPLITPKDNIGFQYG